MTLVEQMMEAAALLAAKPSYVGTPDLRTGELGLALSFGAVDAVIGTDGLWRSADINGVSKPMDRAAMLALLADKFRPVPRVVEASVSDDVFSGKATTITPGGKPQPGSVRVRLVEVVAE